MGPEGEGRATKFRNCCAKPRLSLIQTPVRSAVVGFPMYENAVF